MLPTSSTSSRNSLDNATSSSTTVTSSDGRFQLILRGGTPEMAQSIAIAFNGNSQLRVERTLESTRVQETTIPNVVVNSIVETRREVANSQPLVQASSPQRLSDINQAPIMPATSHDIPGLPRVTITQGGTQEMAEAVADAFNQDPQPLFDVARESAYLVAGIKNRDVWEGIMQTLMQNRSRSKEICEAATPFFAGVTDEEAKQVMIVELVKAGDRMHEICNVIRPFLVQGSTDGHARAQMLDALISSQISPRDIGTLAQPLLEDVRNEEASLIVILGLSRAGDRKVEFAAFLSKYLEGIIEGAAKTDKILALKK